MSKLQYENDHRMLNELNDNEKNIYLTLLKAHGDYFGKRFKIDSKWNVGIIKSYSIATLERVCLERGMIVIKNT